MTNKVIEVVRAVRSIVSSFEKLSFEEQKEALKQLEAAHELSRSAKRAELERQLAELDHGAQIKPARAKPLKMAELGRGAPIKAARAKPLKMANGLAKEKTKRLARKNGKATSVKAKYRDGKTGETWSGRGRMASWLKAKQDAGENIEKYLLN